MSNNKIGKRIFAITCALTITVWSVGLAAVPVAFGAAMPGDLIKMVCTNATPPNPQPTGCDAVYYLGADGNRYVFPNAKIYNTWYADFSTVKEISKAELESYPILIGAASHVTYRPGSKLTKFTTDPRVYAVAKNGTLRWIKTEDVAKALYGNDWYKMIDDLSDVFGAGYKVGADITSASDYNQTAEWNASPSIDVDKSITTGGGPVGTGSKLTVALAADTPASSIVVENAIRVPFTKFTVTASTDGDIVIDTVMVERAGLGQDGAFSGIDLVDSSTNAAINETEKTFNSDHKATFTDDITVGAGQSKSFWIGGNMATSLDAYAGETPAMSIVGITLKGAGSVMGLPISGNYQTLNGTISIGTATVQRGAYTNATSTTIEVGKLAYTFFSLKVQAGSAEDVSFDQIKVYQQGTASWTTDLENVKLYGQKVAGGSQEMLGTGTVKGNYTTFVFSPITIKKGDTFQYEVRADVKDGSARTIDLGIYRNTDLLVKGGTYGYYIKPTFSSTGSSGGNPVLSDNEFTIANGSLQVSKTSDVPTGNITIGTDQEIGSYKFTVRGEPIDITAITLTVASTVATAASVVEDATKGWEIVDSSGKVVAGPADVTNNALTVAMTDTWTVPTGDTIYKIRADVATNSGFASDDSITVAFTPSAMTARGVVTGNTITPTPSSAITSNTRTIKAAALTVTRNSLPATGTVIRGTSQVLLGSWNFDATNAGEDVRITSLAIAASSSDAVNLTLYQGTKTLEPINDAPSSDDDGATSTFTLTEPIVVTKGTHTNIDLKGDIRSTADVGDSTQWGITTGAAVTAYGVTTGNAATVTVTADNGAVLTYSAAGTLTIVNYNSPDIMRVKAGATGVVVNNIRLTSANEDLDLDELYVKIADGTAVTGTAVGQYTDLAMAYVYDGTTLLASGPIGATNERKFNFPDNTLIITRNNNKVITIKIDYAIITSTDNEPGTSNSTLLFGIGGANGIKMSGISSGQTATETYTSGTSNTMILNAAIPMVTLPTTGDRLGAVSALTNGSIKLYAFKVKAESSSSVNRPVMLYRFSFEVTTSGVAGLNITSLRVEDQDSNIIGAAASLTEQEGTSANLVTYVFDSPVISAGDTTEHIEITNGITKTYYLIGTVSGAASGGSVSVSLLSDNATASNELTGARANNFAMGNNGSFVWSDDWRNQSGANAATGQLMWFNGYRVAGLGTAKTTSAYVISF